MSLGLPSGHVFLKETSLGRKGRMQVRRRRYRRERSVLVSMFVKDSSFDECEFTGLSIETIDDDVAGVSSCASCSGVRTVAGAGVAMVSFAKVWEQSCAGIEW